VNDEDARLLGARTPSSKDGDIVHCIRRCRRNKEGDDVTKTVRLLVDQKACSS